MNWLMIRSLLWKFLYGAVVALVAFLSGWLEVNQNPQAWTLATFVAGLGVAAVAFLKKIGVELMQKFLTGDL